MYSDNTVFPDGFQGQHSSKDCIVILVDSKEISGWQILGPIQKLFQIQIQLPFIGIQY